MKLRLKINGVIMFSAFLMVAIFPELFFRQQRIGFLDGVAEVFGITLILFGQILRVSARGYKSEMSFNGHHLAEGGPMIWYVTRCI
jgi:hypothetical protein